MSTAEHAETNRRDFLYIATGSVAAVGAALFTTAAQGADIVGLVPSARPEGGLDTSEFDESAFLERVAWLDEAVIACGRTAPKLAMGTPNCLRRLARSVERAAPGAAVTLNGKPVWVVPAEVPA